MGIKNIIQKRNSIKNIPFLLTAILLIMSCKLFIADEPPGVGEKVERGYAALDPVIKALEQYQTEKDQYPETLEKLVPEFISSIPTEVNDESIFYAKSGESYSLAFHYIGPGMNTCTYTPENDWQCSGAY